jgi:hypothetical protein
MAKFEQWGAGSRRRPQQRAERAARVSQKREDERRWRREEEGRRWQGTDPLPDPSTNIQQAFAIVTIGLMGWEDPPCA